MQHKEKKSTRTCVQFATHSHHIQWGQHSEVYQVKTLQQVKAFRIQVLYQQKRQSNGLMRT